MDTNGNDQNINNNFHNLSNNTVSPQSKRNTKNLSLKLGPRSSTTSFTTSTNTNNNSLNNNNAKQDPIPFPSLNNSPTVPIPQSATLPNTRLFRHPSLSTSKNDLINGSNSSLKRRTTLSNLSLSIPTDCDLSYSKNSSKLSSNSIPSISSSSPITSSSPIIPATPAEYTNFNTASSKRSSSTTSSNKTLGTDDYKSTATNNVMKTQTLIQNLSSIDLNDESDLNKINCYPNGPQCILEPNLFLYSEPKLNELSGFNTVINVAKELTPPIPTLSPLPKDKNSMEKFDKDSTYYFIPWTHTTKICYDLPNITDVIINSLNKGEKVLVHCQFGVSRSASLIVAVLMKLRRLNLNDAYNFVKEKAPEISPNMSLIFQLMEWGEMIGTSTTNTHNNAHNNNNNNNNNNHNINNNTNHNTFNNSNQSYELSDSPISITSKETDQKQIHQNNNDPLMTFR